MLTIVCCVVAFLTGGIPFGYLVGRLILKDDIRRHGSGNIGATNVGRVIGWKWGSCVLVLDAFKGLLPTLAAKLYCEFSELSPEHVLNTTIATGVFAIVGHMYPIYLKLRGGKGVATALGVVLIIAPWASLFALGGFALVIGLTRIVALSSIVAALCFGMAQLWLLGSDALKAASIPLTIFSVAIPSLIIWRHRSNIVRLLTGQEKPFARQTIPPTETNAATNANRPPHDHIGKDSR